MGLETLLRWVHPEMGPVSPALLIPIAEETGLIREIGTWVFFNACKQYQKWYSNLCQDFRIAINVSTKQLINQQLVQDIKQILQETEVPPDKIEIEITESAIMNNIHHSLKNNNSNEPLIYWQDPTNGLFNKYRLQFQKYQGILIIFLNEIYNFDNNKYQKIFIDTLKCEKEPKIIDYVNLLEAIAHSDKKIHDCINDVYLIYEHIYDIINNDNNKEKCNIYEILKYKKIFPCYDRKWVSLEYKKSMSSESEESEKNLLILVDDQIKLAEHFYLLPGSNNLLNYLITNQNVKMEKNQFKNFSDLCESKNLIKNKKLNELFSSYFGIRHFSKIIELDRNNLVELLNGDDNKSSTYLRKTCGQLLEFVQLFMHWRSEFKSIYDFCTKNFEFQQQIEKMKFYTVENLENFYNLNKLLDNYKNKTLYKLEIKVKNKTCIFYSKNKWNYIVRDDCVHNLHDVVREFINFIMNKLLPGIKKIDYDKINEDEMYKFCLLMMMSTTHLKLSELDWDTKQDIERDYKIKLFLPNKVTKWRIKIENQSENNIQNESEPYKAINNEMNTIINNQGNKKRSLSSNEFDQTNAPKKM